MLYVIMELTESQIAREEWIEKLFSDIDGYLLFLNPTNTMWCQDGIKSVKNHKCYGGTMTVNTIRAKVRLKLSTMHVERKYLFIFEGTCKTINQKNSLTFWLIFNIEYH